MLGRNKSESGLSLIKVIEATLISNLEVFRADSSQQKEPVLHSDNWGYGRDKIFMQKWEPYKGSVANSDTVGPLGSFAVSWPLS